MYAKIAQILEAQYDIAATADEIEHFLRTGIRGRFTFEQALLVEDILEDLLN